MKKLSMRGIHQDVLEFKAKPRTLDDLFHEDAFFLPIEKEWKEAQLRRNILKELV